MAADSIVGDISALGPKIEFGDNGVANSLPRTVGTPSGIPGPDDSSWSILQWENNELLSPDAVSDANPSTYSPTLGEDAAYSWATPDGETALAAYSTPAGWVYNIDEQAKPSTGLGEHDLLLSTGHLDIQMDQQVNLSLDAQVTQASLQDNSADPGHQVWAAASTGLTFEFNPQGGPGYDPSLPTFGAFLSILASASQGDAFWLDYTDDGNGVQNGGPTISNQLLPGDADLPFSPGSSPTHLSYDINAYVAAMATRLEGVYGLQAGLSDIDLWHITGMNIGIGASAGGDGLTGTANLGLDVSNVSFTTGGASQSPDFSGSHDQYTVTSTGSVLTVQDDVAGRDGTRTLHQGVDAQFTDGVALLDPTGTMGVAARTYEALFGSLPTATQLTGFTGLGGAGSDAMEFIASAQYLGQVGTPGAVQFVASVLQNAFGTAPDPGQVSVAAAAIQAGYSKSDFVAATVDGAQDEARFGYPTDGSSNPAGAASDANQVFVNSLFRIALGQPGTSSILQAFDKVMVAGVPATAVAATFATAMAAPDTASFVQRAFTNLDAGNAPDAATAAAWTSFIGGGAITQGGALQALADSATGVALGSAASSTVVNHPWAFALNG